MKFLRHVGKHGDRKVAIVFREVPGEPHMALVVYTEILNRSIHDPLIQCIESDIGQNAEDLAIALNKTYTSDGHIILQKLHAEGMLKKVRTEDVVMTPRPDTKIKLSELNQMLDEFKKGEEAVKKLSDMDASLGMQDPIEVAKRMRGDNKVAESPITPTSNNPDVIGDDALANNLRQQAAKMAAEAKGLQAESDRLLQEAEAMSPTIKTVSETKEAKTVKTAKTVKVSQKPRTKGKTKTSAE